MIAPTRVSYRSGKDAGACIKQPDKLQFVALAQERFKASPYTGEPLRGCAALPAKLQFAPLPNQDDQYQINCQLSIVNCRSVSVSRI